MRIAMMTNNYKPYVGGVPISVERLADGLRARGHSVTVFAPNYPGLAPEADVIRLRPMKQLWKGDYQAPSVFDPAIEAAFCAGNFDVIHVHHPVLLGHAGLHLSRKYNVPLAFTYHTHYEQYLHHAKLKAGGLALRLLQRAVPLHNRVFMNRCDTVFAPTPKMRDSLAGMGVSAPIEVLPTGLEAADFQPDAAKSEALRRRFSPDGRPLLCTVARVEPEKNIGFLLRALAAHKTQGGLPCRLLVIGKGSARAALEAEAAALGLADDVCFVGGVPHEELPAWYGACQLFVFASKSETQGIVLLEAMAAGLPVLAFSASGVDDIVRDGVNGLRTGEDEALFAAELGGLLAAPERCRSLGAGALASARGYGASAVAAMAEGHYQHMLAGRETARRSVRLSLQ